MVSVTPDAVAVALPAPPINRLDALSISATNDPAGIPAPEIDEPRPIPAIELSEVIWALVLVVLPVGVTEPLKLWRPCGSSALRLVGNAVVNPAIAHLQSRQGGARAARELS